MIRCIDSLRRAHLYLNSLIEVTDFNQQKPGLGLLHSATSSFIPRVGHSKGKKEKGIDKGVMQKLHEIASAGEFYAVQRAANHQARREARGRGKGYRIIIDTSLLRENRLKQIGKKKNKKRESQKRG